jgi:hypothetical protein
VKDCSGDREKLLNDVRFPVPPVPPPKLTWLKFHQVEKITDHAVDERSWELIG